MATDKSNLAWIDGWRTRFDGSTRPPAGPDKQKGWDAANAILIHLSILDEKANTPDVHGGYG